MKTRPVRTNALAALLLAASAVAGCSNATHGAYDTCDVDARHCSGVGVEGCSVVRVEYPDHVATQGICTAICTVDSDCPRDSRGLDGACTSFDGGGISVCFERCRTDEDCPDALGCVDRLEDSTGMFIFFDPVCLPR